MSKGRTESTPQVDWLARVGMRIPHSTLKGGSREEAVGVKNSYIRWILAPLRENLSVSLAKGVIEMGAKCNG